MTNPETIRYGILDDNRDLVQMIRLILSEKHGFTNVFHKGTFDEAMEKVSEPDLAETVDVIFVDGNFKEGIHTGEDGLAILEILRSIHPGIKIVWVSASTHNFDEKVVPLNIDKMDVIPTLRDRIKKLFADTPVKSE